MSLASAKSQLNSAQRQAVEQLYGPVLVLAGPGTGKTQMLTVRIAEILQKIDTDPRNILCLTFTESATTEMRNRLQRWIGPAAYQVKISTFHGFCQSVMDDFPEIFLSKVQNRVIADDLQRALTYQSVIQSGPWPHFRSVWDDLFARNDFLRAVSDLKREHFSAEKLRSLIPEEKIRLESNPANFYKNKFKEFQSGDWKPTARVKIDRKIEKLMEFCDLWEAYEKELAKRSLFDFDDQINWVVNELESNENLRLDLQEKYQWILADEYQDTNASQNAILWALTDGVEQPNLFAVGDDDQSIYRFQGASSANITDFRGKFPSRVEVTLEQNYRSVQPILDAAYHSVAQNLDRANADKKLTAALAKPNNVTPITKVVFSSPYQEMNWLVETIRAQLSSGISAENIAILVRKNREIETLARELPKFGIPVAADLSLNIFENEAVSWLVQMMTVFANVRDDEVLFDLLHAPFLGISAENLLRLSLERNQQKVPLAQLWLDREKRDEVRIAHSEAQKEVVFQFFKPIWKESFGIDTEKHKDNFFASTVAFISDDNGKTLGAIQLAEIEPQIWKIRRIAVLPEFQNQGFGRKLMAWALDYIEQKNPRKIWLNAETSRLSFYEKLGFQTVADPEPLKLKPDLNAVKMEKDFGALDLFISTTESEHSESKNLFHDEKIRGFFEFFVSARKEFHHMRPAALAEKLLYESGLADWLTKTEKHIDWQCIRRFIDWVREQDQEKSSAFAKASADMAEILARVDLHCELGIPIRPGKIPSDGQAIRIMTAHKSKGLEFHTVFVPNLSDKTWGNPRKMVGVPLPAIVEQPDHDPNEEERRLFFVALTRAKQQIFLSYHETDLSNRTKTPSLFWHEISADFSTELSTDDTEADLQKLLPVFLAQQEKTLTNGEKEILQEKVKNFVWSASSLQTYLECPRKFLYQYLYKFPRRPLPQFALGTALHQALERFLPVRPLCADSRHSQIEGQKDIRGKLTTESNLISEFEHALTGQNVPQSEFKKLLVHGQKVLSDYYEQRLKHQVVSPFGVELEYDVGKFFPQIGEIRLTGKIDKIVFTDEAKKSAEIWDYKSGKPRPIKPGERLWRQLVFYDLLVRNSRAGWTPVQCGLDFLTPDATGKIQQKTLEITESDRGQVIEELKHAHASVLNLEFPVVPNPTGDREIEFWNNFGGN